MQLENNEHQSIKRVSKMILRPNNQFTNPWTKEHLQLLRMIYPNKNIGFEEMERIFNRGRSSIRTKANSLGLSRIAHIPHDRRCSSCQSTTTPRNWYKLGDGFICSNCWKSKHYKGKSKIRNHTLSKTSATGKGLIGEQVVCKYLGTKNNNIENDKFAGNPVDIHHEILGRINVKGRKLVYTHELGKNYYFWKFSFRDMYAIDTYFLLGYDIERRNIIKAWIIPKKELKNNTLYIGDSVNGLLKYSKYEINAEPLNTILHTLGKSGCKYLYDV